MEEDKGEINGVLPEMANMLKGIKDNQAKYFHEMRALRFENKHLKLNGGWTKNGENCRKNIIVKVLEGTNQDVNGMAEKTARKHFTITAGDTQVLYNKDTKTSFEYH